MTAVVAHAQRPARSLGVGKILLAAAVLGIVGGIVLARAQDVPKDFEVEAEALAAKVIPAPPPVAPPPDMMAPDPLSLRGIPPYPGADPRRILGARPGAEQLMAISWFTTGDSVDKVLGFYEEAFAAANLLYTSHRYSDRRGYVSWFEHDYSDDKAPVFGKGVMHMVSVTREGEQTTVLVSATEPQKILENLTPLPAGVKLPPGATPQVLNLSEFGQQRAAIIASYDQNRDRVVEQLQDLWKQTGWQVVERNASELGTTSLVAVLNQRQQTVVIEGAGDKTQLFVTLEERHAP